MYSDLAATMVILETTLDRGHTHPKTPWTSASYSPSFHRSAAVEVMAVATPKTFVVTAPRGPPADGTVQLEAYSDPGERYSRLTFCNGFFNLLSLTEAIEQGKSKPAAAQINLETWNSRARTFFVKQYLDCFTNAPKKTPYVGDTTFSYKVGEKSNKAEGYGRSMLKF